MMENKALVKKNNKYVFVIESDPVRKAEIREALRHQHTWKLEFFSSPEACTLSLHKNPMVIFLDIEHFGKDSTLDKGYMLVSELHKRSHVSEIIVFTEAENEGMAAIALKNGAMDYIVLNEHQFAKMESELNWIERVHEQRIENNRQKRLMMLIIAGLVVFIASMFLLDYFGLIREGGNHDVLLED